MVATKMILEGGRKKTHHKRPKRKLTAKAAKKVAKTVSVPKRPRYVKPGNKSITKDPLKKCGKVCKSGPHKGMCKVVLSKKGQKVRARQLARKASKKKK